MPLKCHVRIGLQPALKCWLLRMDLSTLQLHADTFLRFLKRKDSPRKLEQSKRLAAQPANPKPNPVLLSIETLPGKGNHRGGSQLGTCCRLNDTPASSVVSLGFFALPPTVISDTPWMAQPPFPRRPVGNIHCPRTRKSDPSPNVVLPTHLMRHQTFLHQERRRGPCKRTVD